MALSLLKIGFALLASFTLFLHNILVALGDRLPAFVQASFLYGKFSYKGPSWNIRVPKSWFKHFYIFASLVSSLGLGLMISVYIVDISPSPGIIKWLDFFGGSGRTANPKVSSSASLLVMFLLTVQSWKRLYETQWVSVYSNSMIDISHYLIGYFHYFGAVLAILVEAPGFTGSPGSFRLSLSDLTVQSIAAALVFLWASHQQLVCATILSDLRKNNKGEVVNYKHKIPEGAMFEWLSAPHLVCEIVMYAAITMIILGNTTWMFVFGWVLSNQAVTAIRNHWWYQAEFKTYPKKRCALVPYIY